MKISTIDAGQFRESIFFSLTIRRPGVRSKVRDLSALEAYLEQLQAAGEDETATSAVDVPKNFKANGSKGAVNVTKRILMPRPRKSPDDAPDPYDAAVGFLGATKEALVGRFGKALPSRIQEGLFVVRKDLVQEFQDKLTAALAELQSKYIPDMRSDYEAAKLRAKETPVKQGGLGPLYREADYASADAFCSQFNLEWTWLALGIPEDLPAALRAEATAKLEKQFTEAAEEVKSALRASFAELISHATERLKPAGPGERPAVFRNSLTENISQFIECFGARNLMGDTELEALVNQAKTVLVGLNPDRLRRYANVREQTREQFLAIQTQLDGMLTEQKTRRFDLD